MKNVRKPSLFFGLFIAAIFFVSFFLLATENQKGYYVLYAALILGAIYWIWSIIEVTSADDLKKYQKTFWLIIVVAVPFFGALLFNVMHLDRNKMVA
jgi:4-hydroxybenzoate polyprenyltransferase